MGFAYILQVHESMDTWNSIFCTTRNTQLQDTKMLGGVKRKSEKERGKKECGRQFGNMIHVQKRYSEQAFRGLSEE